MSSVPRRPLRVAFPLIPLIVAAGISVGGTLERSPASVPDSAPAGTSRPPSKPEATARDVGIIARDSAVRGGPPPDLVILYAGEVMGWTEPCG